MTAVEWRTIPGTKARCRRCGATVVWAKTQARAGGPGGKPMPVDPVEHPDGNVALDPVRPGRLYARVLGTGETAQRPLEYLAMPHFATCGAGR
ncbi:hypothetical protein QWY28_17495 [Nocardioides sp. SOB77]|uniref:Uncharacterized protein n=1 Tax=Nocardioides oceani TaxID=3058369 RepID=A0ABT8FJQ2_9ACTN|nr:hypothetical protein [Nocardioides oceani]MDN4174760.1 hypothetical protein [Nocardioides oceani]